MHLEMTALVLQSAERGTFEAHHNHLCADHILAMVAHTLENILGLCWWWVVNCVSCCMESSDKTVEPLEIAAVKAGYHTHVAVDIDWFVSQIDCLCQWQFVNSSPMILNCLHGIVASQIGHLDEPYSPSSVQIYWSTCSVNNDGCKLL